MKHNVPIWEKSNLTVEEAAQTFIGTVIKGQEIANADTLKWTYFIAAVILVVVAIPMFFYGFKNTKERFTAENPGFEICIPSIKYCTDNAAMIGAAGYQAYLRNEFGSLDLGAQPSKDLCD